MTRIEIALRPEPGKRGKSVLVEARDVRSALTIADINLVAGCADILADGRCLARLTRHGRGNSVFWEVSEG